MKQYAVAAGVLFLFLMPAGIYILSMTANWWKVVGFYVFMFGIAAVLALIMKKDGYIFR